MPIKVEHSFNLSCSTGIKLQIKNKPDFWSGDSIIHEISRYKQVAPVDFSP